jgi:hypothetical protein
VINPGTRLVSICVAVSVFSENSVETGGILGARLAMTLVVTPRPQLIVKKRISGATDAAGPWRDRVIKLSVSKGDKRAMVHVTQMQVNRSDIRETRIAEHELSDDLPDGAIILEIDRFALTANNVTYAASGDLIGYWKFFPVDDPWGLVPVWGFADITASNSSELSVGERIYGFFPSSSHVQFQPGKVRENGFVDTATHRQALPALYNEYHRVSTTKTAALENIQMLFQPLFATSFLLHDFFVDNDCFGAEAIILGSASSKTAMGVARQFAQSTGPKPRIIGLTSAGNHAFVEGLGLYDLVLPYDQIKQIPQEMPSSYIDIAGNAQVRQSLHNHFGDQMVYSCAVGMSHWDQFADTGPMPGAKPIFFFAPDQALKRRSEWGGAVLQERIAADLHAWASSGMPWLNIVEKDGASIVVDTFGALRDGRSNPTEGLILSF